MATICKKRGQHVCVKVGGQVQAPPIAYVGWYAVRGQSCTRSKPARNHFLDVILPYSSVLKPNRTLLPTMRIGLRTSLGSESIRSISSPSVNSPRRSRYCFALGLRHENISSTDASAAIFSISSRVSRSLKNSRMTRSSSIGERASLALRLVCQLA
jgi:hypothetical protein